MKRRKEKYAQAMKAANQRSQDAFFRSNETTSPEVEPPQ